MSNLTPNITIADKQSELNVLFSTVGLLKKGVTVKKGYLYLEGVPLGQITGQKIFVPCKCVPLAADAAAAQAVINVGVDQVDRWNIGDAIQVTGEAAMTVAGKSSSAGTLTLSANLVGLRATGVLVKGTDGSQVAQCVALNSRDMRLEPADGFINIALAGHLKKSMIKGYSAQTATDLTGVISAIFDIFKF